MATLPLLAPVSLLQDAISANLARDHWLERLQRGYFKIKALCVHLNLPMDGAFFDGCMTEYARAYRGAGKGTKARNVEILSAVVVYRQALMTGIPLKKSLLITHLSGPRPMVAFQRVLATISKDAPRQDPRLVVSRLVSAILNGIAAPTEVVEAAAQIMARSLNVFLLTKLHVSAAAIVITATLVTDFYHEIRLTRVATFAKVAPSAVNHCLATAATRLGKPLPDSPSKCGNTLKELFVTGIQPPSI
ncbi:MAG: hypothetical protein RBG13Loki_1844 [Promethearchaeota archaeon CR_4]|nr:MAG: hypothetical protein RBG13Loki_1844 [Candidatus Lokiarchaeota archaeon CR_4]